MSEGLLFDGLGATCTFPGCGRHDYLPVRCVACKGVYCQSHSTQQQHQCPKELDVVPKCPLCNSCVPLSFPGENPNIAVDNHIKRGCSSSPATVAKVPERMNFCSFANCTANEHVLILCKYCGNNFCVAHRLEGDHNCRYAKLGMGRVLGGAAGRRSPPPVPKSAEVFCNAQPSNTAKTAIGVTKYSADSCVEIKVFFPVNRGVPPCYFVFPPGTPVGKILDVTLSHAGIKNPNATTTDPAQRYLIYNAGTCAPLDLSSTIQNAVGNRKALTLLIEHGPCLTDEIAAAVMKYLR